MPKQKIIWKKLFSPQNTYALKNFFRPSNNAISDHWIDFKKQNRLSRTKDKKMKNEILNRIGEITTNVKTRFGQVFENAKTLKLTTVKTVYSKIKQFLGLAIETTKHKQTNNRPKFFLNRNIYRLKKKNRFDPKTFAFRGVFVTCRISVQEKRRNLNSLWTKTRYHQESMSPVNKVNYGKKV